MGLQRDVASAYTSGPGSSFLRRLFGYIPKDPDCRVTLLGGGQLPTPQSAMHCHGLPVIAVSVLCSQSKIKKRAWVLHECLERVPENVEAAKELLQYGLKGTDLEALLAIGKGEDNGRCVSRMGPRLGL